jgi:ribosomal protein S18 acetylase RimI-like enzyme
MNFKTRRYDNDRDDERIRQFLDTVYLRNERHEYSWPLYRWDYWRWHINENIFKFNLEAAVFLWETADNHLAGVLNPDNPGEACLQVHPDCRSIDLEVSMMSTAETQFAITQPDGRQKLTIWSPSGDILRQEILRRRGYVRQAGIEYQLRRVMEGSIGDVRIPQGYTIRPLGDQDELPARSWLSWKVFHPDEPDDHYSGWEWYRNVQRAPLYRHDLDLVAVSPEGELAAFCTLWVTETTCTAAYEPVGTHPAHQRLGLGRAIMTEGLHRLQLLGVTLATVDAYSKAAIALYMSVGFTQSDLNEPWVKVW